MLKRKDIDAIIFDLVGVLLFPKEIYKPNDIVDKIDSMIGKVTNDNLFKQRVQNTFNITKKEFIKILDQIVEKYEAETELWSLLPRIKKHYKLAIINNGTALTLKRFDEKLHFDIHFDALISSAIQGIRKPNPQIFLNTAKQLKIEPSKCLFMDDLIENINGAKKTGMKTILWKNKEIGLKTFKKFLNIA